MFTTESDQESNVMQKSDFIKHVDLDEAFFESESTNSHVLKQARMMRRIANQRKLNTECHTDQMVLVLGSKPTDNEQKTDTPK